MQIQCVGVEIEQYWRVPFQNYSATLFVQVIPIAVSTGIRWPGWQDSGNGASQYELPQVSYAIGAVIV
ncbi:MAG: hypothetical protein EDM05_050455 [Leptolyngbya sp. IPPAS B-1204]|nr:hypothetical protein [Elainella sp. C42_A2020_010]RNJ66316.1 MAG: hypothetical protein EDM05_26280 [Leptolyngbya sp. IPPAS B-1204]